MSQSTNKDRYYVNDVEVKKSEFVAAERRNGFYNTMGQPTEPATASFGNSRTGDHGRVVYAELEITGE